MSSLIFALSTLALIVDVVRSVLKILVTLGDISLVLLHLIKIFHICSVQTPSPNVQAVMMNCF